MGLRESKPLIANSLLAAPTGIISGIGSIGGEIINSFCRFLILIYSSKRIFTSELLKLFVKFSGSDFIIDGGVVSKSPPDGLPLFAHEFRVTSNTIPIIYFNSFMDSIQINV